MEAVRNPEAIAAQSYSTFLKAVEAPGAQKRLALEMGVSEATISRLKASAEQVCRAFAYTNHIVEPVEESQSYRPSPEVIRSLAALARDGVEQIVKQMQMQPNRE